MNRSEHVCVKLEVRFLELFELDYCNRFNLTSLREYLSMNIYATKSKDSDLFLQVIRRVNNVTIICLKEDEEYIIKLIKKFKISNQSTNNSL